MSAEIIDGNAIAAAVRADVADQVKRLSEDGIRPGLAAVLVGDDPASHVYVRMKRRDCEEVGIADHSHVLPSDTTQDELEAIIDELNADPDVHGMIVQLPLPDQLDADAAIERIDPAKDADGFHPTNLGRLLMGRPGPVPATPKGIVRLLDAANVETEGAHAVVVGRSTIVGKPLALLLLLKGTDATVNVAHSRTRDLGALTRDADILVAAVGRPGLITADMVRPGAAVIDVGINRIDAPETDKGYRLVGDVAYDEVAEVAGHITPVPGGVGPMTRAMLLENVVEAAARGQ